MIDTNTYLANVDATPSYEELVELGPGLQLRRVGVDLAVLYELEKLLLGILYVGLGASDNDLRGTC